VFAALAEFERDLIRERTCAGLAAARARARRGGRPSVMSAHKLKVAREMYGSEQYTVAAIEDPWRQPSLDLPAPHRRQWLTESPQRRTWLQDAAPTA
jgi:hypothetical protein